MRGAIAVLALVLVGACGSGASADGPEAAVKSYLQALESGDCAGVQDVARSPDDVECDVIEDSADLFGDLDPDTATYTVGDEAGPSATVTVKWGVDDAPDEVYEVQQMDGDWKVVLDSAV